MKSTVVPGLLSLLLLGISLLAGCEAPREREAPPERSYKIKYVNAGLLFEFMVNGDPEARALKKQKGELLQAIADLDEKIRRGEVEKNSLARVMEEKRAGLQALRGREEYFKNRFFNEINRAIESVSKRIGADFVLNLGESVVFARGEYDITEEVMREIVRMKNRSNPQSR